MYESAANRDQLRSQTQPYYERFQTLVQALCDNSMQQPNSFWRNSYYACSLDKVSAMSIEFEKQHPPYTENAPMSQSVLNVVQPVHAPTPIRTSAPPPVIDQWPDTISPPPSSTGFTSPNCSTFSGFLTTETSPTVASQVSPSSPQGITFKENLNETVYCSCGEAFHGVSRYTNLQRHVSGNNLFDI